MMEELTTYEIVVRGVLITENIALLILTGILLGFYLSRSWELLWTTNAENALRRRRAWHVVCLGVGNSVLYTTFFLAILINTGSGVTGWQIAFSVAFAIILAGTYLMMRYQMSAYRYRVKESMYLTEL